MYRMKTSKSQGQSRKPIRMSRLFVRMDAASKRYLSEAAALRRMSISDYVRLVAVPQARREVESARDGIIVMTPDEQLAFWKALNRPVKLTAAQRRLGKLVRAMSERK
jgi:uncharacterized protein (DUF1778 family)